MNNLPLVWIIMGVAGSGKTSVGRLLSERLESDFLEGDRRHPLSNVIKMISQKPLQDEDRRQWLLEIQDDIQRAINSNREIVLTCSALKLSYRQQLTSSGRVQLVWLNVPRSELERRLANRNNHYMKPEMLHSQIAAFEAISPEEKVITIDGLLSVADIVNEIFSQTTELFPSINEPWWYRCSD
jgi:gluconokinase